VTVTTAVGNVHTNFLHILLAFELRKGHTGGPNGRQKHQPFGRPNGRLDRQCDPSFRTGPFVTDKRRDGQTRPVVRPIRTAALTRDRR